MSGIITISREFGSGGREIGFYLAEKLRIPLYDKELISLAAENSNIAEEVFDAHEEMIAVPRREEQLYVSSHPFSTLYEIPVSDQIFLAQSQVIKKLEQEGPCVIIGRCSDIIVDDGFHVFICAAMKHRLDRIIGMEKDADRRKIENRIREIDKKRRDYYQYYSGNEWGNPKNYHLCLNSGRLGIQNCVDIIAAGLKKYG